MTRRHAAVGLPMRRAAIYCRISADREGRELGVERQQEDCQALATRIGCTVAETYVDNDVSASTRSTKPRPEYRRMLAAAAAGKFDVVIAYTSSRLTRRPREHEDLIDLAEHRRIEFAYVQSPSFDLNTAAGRRIARILAANDAGEAEDIQERVRRAKQQAAAHGEWKGGPRPFGYEADGNTVQPEEAAELLTASHAVLMGVSLLSLTADLNRRGIATATGRQWQSSAIGRVLRRPRNAGLMEHQGQIVGRAAWEPIVPEEIWRGVRAVLDDPARRTSPGNVRRWLGSGLYLCHCGATMRVHISGGKRPGAHPAYTCSVTKHLTRHARGVDAFVSDVVVERLSRNDAVDLLAPDTREEHAASVLQAAALRARLDDLAAAYAIGAVTLSQLTTASSLLRNELLGLEQQIAAVSGSSVLEGLVGRPDTSAVWKGLHLDRKRAVIDRLMVVELWAANRGRRKGWRPGESYFDPSTVKIHWKA